MQAVVHFRVVCASDDRDASIERLDSWSEDHTGMIAMVNELPVITIFFDIVDPDTYVTAALALAGEVRATGLITHLTVDFDLVNTTDIGIRSGRTRQAIRQYIEGIRGPGNFPAPVGEPGGVRVWDWGTVNEWLRTLDNSGDPEYHPPNSVLHTLQYQLQRVQDLDTSNA